MCDRIFLDTMLKNIIVELLRDIAKHCELSPDKIAVISMIAEMITEEESITVADKMFILKEKKLNADQLFMFIFSCVSDGESSLVNDVIEDINKQLTDENRITIDKYIRQMKIIYDKR